MSLDFNNAADRHFLSVTRMCRYPLGTSLGRCMLQQRLVLLFLLLYFFFTRRGRSASSFQLHPAGDLAHGLCLTQKATTLPNGSEDRVRFSRVYLPVIPFGCCCCSKGNGSNLRRSTAC